MIRHHTPTPRKRPVTWVLVADGKHAKIYTRQPVARPVIADNAKHPHIIRLHTLELVPVPGMEWQAESVENYEIGRNRLGRVFESGSTARHMSEPHADIYEEIRQKLVHEVAGQLNDARAKRKFQRLTLVAPAKLLGEFKKCLDERTLKAVTLEVPKNLAHTEMPALSAFLESLF